MFDLMMIILISNSGRVAFHLISHEAQQGRDHQRQSWRPMVPKAVGWLGATVTPTMEYADALVTAAMLQDVCSFGVEN